jgi:polyphosphate kinase
MERNLDRRVEVLCPVLDPELSGYLRDVVLQAYLSDTEQVTTMGADGTYSKSRAADAPVDAQQALLTRHLTKVRI